MEYRRTEAGWFLRLDRGEELVETLTSFLADKDVRFGAVSAIGAVERPVLGLFSMETREYVKRPFTGGTYELVALTGNVSTVEGGPFAHLHALLSDAECRVIGGHLFEAVVAVTCEIDLRVYAGEVARRHDPETTLNLLDLNF